MKTISKVYSKEYLLAILDAWIKIHGIPAASDFMNNPITPSYKSYQNHFGSWNKSLELLGYGVNLGHRKSYSRYRGEMKHQGYIMVYLPKHPKCDRDGYILKHRVIVESCINRYLRSSEIVHHINGNREDNIIGNLEILTRRKHSQLHALKMHEKRRSNG